MRQTNMRAFKQVRWLIVAVAAVLQTTDAVQHLAPPDNRPLDGHDVVVETGDNTTHRDSALLQRRSVASSRVRRGWLGDVITFLKTPVEIAADAAKKAAQASVDAASSFQKLTEDTGSFFETAGEGVFDKAKVIAESLPGDAAILGSSIADYSQEFAEDFARDPMAHC